MSTELARPSRHGIAARNGTPIVPAIVARQLYWRGHSGAGRWQAVETAIYE
ncbi:MAG: hypothetical protein ACLQIB_31790 [Isosphaeraceae bacterium]